MKKNLLSIFCLIASVFVNAQLPQNYYFQKVSNATYTPITGGILLGNAATDDQVFVDASVPLGINSNNISTITGVGLPIGFSFTYNNEVFDRIAVCANGFITFGKSSLNPAVNVSQTSTNTYYSQPILSQASSASPTYLRSRVGAFAVDLTGQTGSELRVQTIGTAPNRTCVIQWDSYKAFGVGDVTGLNFQIRLNETTNIVTFAYGDMHYTNTASKAVQIGLSGSVSSSFWLLKGSSFTAPSKATANTDNMGFSSTNVPAIGAVYNFSPTCTPTTSTFTKSACNSYTWASKGNKVYTESNNTDTIHLTNAGGCDSLVTLNLTIKTASTSTTNVDICPSQLPYSWNGSRTAAGTYTYTTTNSQGCDSVATLNLTVSSPTTPSVSITPSQNNVCLGGAITFTATPVNGGASPSFEWKKNGVAVIGAGNGSTYSFVAGALANGDTVSCVMTANNACQTTATANSNKVGMILKSGPAIGTSTGGTICTIGGTLTIYNTNTQGGGVWTTDDASVATITTISGANGAVVAKGTGTVTMSYTKTSSSNGCKAVALAVVTVAPIAAPAAIVAPVGLCKGATTTLTDATPGGVWKSINTSTATIDSVTGVTTGVYQGTANIRYTVKNAYGCTNSASVSLPVSNIPSVPSIYYASVAGNPQVGPNSSFCVNDTFSVVGKMSPVVAGTGTWISSNPSAVTISNTGLIKIVSVGNTSITYTFTTTLGCANSRTVTGVKTAICPGHRGIVNNNSQLISSNDFTMYPNPAKSFISLSVNKLIGQGQIVVTDLYGKQVKAQSLSMGTNTVDISNLAKGFYFVSTITEQGKTTKKLVVE